MFRRRNTRKEIRNKSYDLSETRWRCKWFQHRIVISPWDSIESELILMMMECVSHKRIGAYCLLMCQVFYLYCFKSPTKTCLSNRFCKLQTTLAYLFLDKENDSFTVEVDEYSSLCSSNKSRHFSMIRNCFSFGLFVQVFFCLPLLFMFSKRLHKHSTEFSLKIHLTTDLKVD